MFSGITYETAVTTGKKVYGNPSCDYFIKHGNNLALLSDGKTLLNR